MLLVNAQHVKAVPGRKTDVKDCEWLAQLLEHGLLRGSFVPPQPIRDLRDLTRYRKTLIQERSAHINRLAKTLEMANIKLGTVATDILGKSGRSMIEAIIANEADPDRLARLAQGNLRKKHEALVPALTGRVRPHHVFMLRHQLRVIATSPTRSPSSTRASRSACARSVTPRPSCRPCRAWLSAPQRPSSRRSALI